MTNVKIIGKVDGGFRDGGADVIVTIPDSGEVRAYLVRRGDENGVVLCPLKVTLEDVKRNA